MDEEELLGALRDWAQKVNRVEVVAPAFGLCVALLINDLRTNADIGAIIWALIGIFVWGYALYKIYRETVKTK